LAGNNIAFSGASLDLSGAITAAGGNAALVATAGGIDHDYGRLTTGGALALTAAGAVSNRYGNLQAGGALDLDASSLDNTAGRIVSLNGASMTVGVGGPLVNSGGGLIGGNGNVTLGAGAFDNSGGSIVAGGKLTATASTLTNDAGSLTAGGTLSITAAGIVSNRQGEIEAGGALALDATSMDNTSGRIVSLNADGLRLGVGGQLTNAGGGLIGGNGNVTINAGSIANSAGIRALAALAVSTTGVLDNSDGSLSAGSAVTAAAGTTFKNSRGTVSAGTLAMLRAAQIDNRAGGIIAGQLDVTAADLDNRGGHVTQTGSGAIAIAVTGTLNNAGGGLETGSADLTLAPASLINDQGTIAHAGNGLLAIVSDTLSNVGGSIVTNGTAAITANAIDNHGGGTIAANSMTVQVHGAFNNAAGLVQANHGLSLGAQSLANVGGSLINIVDGVLSIGLTGALANTQGGYIGSNDRIEIQAGSIDNAAGVLYGKSGLALQASGIISNRSGTMRSDANLGIVAGGKLDNTGGRIEATGAHSVVAIATDSIDNAGGRIANEGDGKTTVGVATRIDNSNAGNASGMGTIGGNGDVEIDAATLVNTQSGRVLAGGDLLLQVSAALNNTAGTLHAAGNLTFNQAAATLQNAQGTITAADDVRIAAAGFGNQGGTVSAGRDVALSVTQSNAFTGAGSVTSGRDIALSLQGNQTNAAGNRIKANRNLGIAISGALANQGMLEAVDGLDIDAASIDNQAGGIVDADSTTLTASGAIANAGRIEGNTLTANSAALTNAGTIVGGAVTLNANTLTNSGAAALIGATETLNLFVASSLTNDTGANLYSLGDINAGADGTLDANGYLANKMASFTNSSATVEAGNRLRISANQIVNKRTVLDVRWGSEQTGSYVGGNPRYTRYYTTEYVAANTTPAGRILSGGNMWLLGNIANQYSTVTAGGNILYNAAALTQTARALMEIESDRGIQDNYQYVQTGSHHCGFLGYSICADYGWVNYPVAYNASSQYQIGSVAASFTANGSISGSATTLTNQTVNSTGAVGGSAATLGAPAPVAPAPGSAPGNVAGPNGAPSAVPAVAPGSNGSASSLAPLPPLNLPTNGLFTWHSAPAAPYLIETDPRFANYSTFLSSDYMLSRLPMDPQGTHKRLGDAFYEQTLINQQIVSQTGRKLLAGQTDTQAEYRALMDGGLAAAQTLNLTAGVALSKEQVAALTRDIVWLVAQDVTLPNGSKDRVLVPVVYLTAAHIDLKPSGALIAANDIDLNVGTLANSGAIKSDAATRIAGIDLVNRGGTIAAGTDLALTASNDLANQSGTLSGRRIALTAGRDLTNTRVVDTVQLGPTTTTRLHAEATIAATDSLTLAAGRDVANTAANLTAGTDATVSAGRNLDIGAIAASETTGHQFGAFGRTEQLTSTVKAGNDLTLVAANDATLTAAKVSAGNDLTLAAGGNATLAAVKDVAQSHSDSGVQKRSAYDETVRGTSLDAGNALLVTAGNGSTGRSDGKGNVSLAAAQLTSRTGSLTVAAVTIAETAERHESMVETRTEKKGFFSKTTTVEGSSSQRSDAIGSTLSGDSLIVQSGTNLTVRGSDVVATNDATLTAGKTLALEAATNTQANRSFKQETRLTVTADFSNQSSTLTGQRAALNVPPRRSSAASA
jgi:filamentous hemagglutinin